MFLLSPTHCYGADRRAAVERPSERSERHEQIVIRILITLYSNTFFYDLSCETHQAALLFNFIFYLKHYGPYFINVFLWRSPIDVNEGVAKLCLPFVIYQEVEISI